MDSERQLFQYVEGNNVDLASQGVERTNTFKLPHANLIKVAAGRAEEFDIRSTLYGKNTQDNITIPILTGVVGVGHDTIPVYGWRFDITFIDTASSAAQITYRIMIA